MSLKANASILNFFCIEQQFKFNFFIRTIDSYRPCHQSQQVLYRQSAYMAGFTIYLRPQSFPTHSQSFLYYPYISINTMIIIYKTLFKAISFLQVPSISTKVSSLTGIKCISSENITQTFHLIWFNDAFNIWLFIFSVIVIASSPDILLYKCKNF